MVFLISLPRKCLISVNWYAHLDVFGCILLIIAASLLERICTSTWTKNGAVPSRGIHIQHVYCFSVLSPLVAS